MSKQLSPLDDLKNNIEKLGPQFKAALPSHITVKKFTRVLMTAVSTNPTLAQANRTSLFAACMNLAQQGLLPDSREAAIVTFKNKDGDSIAQAMPMVAGILKKVRNSGELASITSQIVHKNDKFKFWVDGDGEKLEHEPLMFGDRGDRIGVYALAKTKDGALYVEVLTTQQVEAVKSSSRSAKYGPWAGPFEDEMWKKTAIRRLSKRLPMSTDLTMTVESDDEMYDLPKAHVDSEPEKEKSTKPKKLKEVIEATAANVSDEPPPAPDTHMDETPI